MAETPKYKLQQPAQTDKVNIGVLNNNMSIIDTNMNAIDNEVGKRAKKPTAPTAGNFAALDGDGNLVDSKKKSTDFGSANDLNAHTGNKSNPHNVTATQAGAIPATALTNNAPAALGSSAAAGSSGDVSRRDHVHPFPTLANLGAAPTSHASPQTTHGVASATNYGHAMASSANPLAPGTANPGTDNGKFAREGHVHPAQSSVSLLNEQNAAYYLNYRNFTNCPTIPSVPPYNTTNPLAAGTATAGTANTIARGDHRHPAEAPLSTESQVTNSGGGSTNNLRLRKIGKMVVLYGTIIISGSSFGDYVITDSADNVAYDSWFLPSGFDTPNRSFRNRLLSSHGKFVEVWVSKTLKAITWGRTRNTSNTNVLPSNAEYVDINIVYTLA